MATTMVPPAELLPDVLPTDRLGPTAKPRPPLRDELRTIPTARAAFAVVSLLAMTIGILVAAAWLANPFGYAAAFVLEGAMIVRFNILGHEAAHRLLFRNQRLNDGGRPLAAGLPGLRRLRRLPALAHRPPRRRARPRRARHRRSTSATPSPGTRCAASWCATPSASRGGRTSRACSRRHAATRPARWPAHPRRAGWCSRACAPPSGRPELYLLWLGPWMTVWRVLNRLRAIAEHGGMHALARPPR